MATKKTDEQGGVRKKIQDYSYVLTHNIGKGYSSQVFKGRNDVTENVVAVKVIDMRMIRGQVHKNLLSSQIEVLQSLKGSPNIIEVFDIFNTKNNTYIITQLCEGGDLSKVISNRKSIPEDEAILLMSQILLGYNHMQSKGIIHRDLKPANIFMKQGEPKLADFGFAMKQSDGKKYSSYNVGSPVYMPPQALNENKYSFKSDIWALGVIYFEMLTGKTPWRAKSQKDLGRQLLSIPIAKLLPAGINAKSEEFLTKTLNININDRMSPEELQRFTFNIQHTFSRNPTVFSSENSLFDQKNPHTRQTGLRIMQRNDRHDSSLNKRRHETSLNKNTVSTPNNARWMQEMKNNNISLPKTAATIANRTQKQLQSAKSINSGQALCQKQINIVQKEKEITYDKKYMSKQILSQIHFCRFLYKLLIRINEKLSIQTNSSFQLMKQEMAGLIFSKLQDIQDLKGTHRKYVQDYKISPDFHKIIQILQQYKTKYTKDLAGIRHSTSSLSNFKEQLTRNIISLYNQVDNHEEINQWKEEVIVLDYLVTLRQLVSLQQNNDLEGFHNKSKIQAIVEGSPSKTITQDHLSAIRNKLKAIKIL